MNDTQNKEIVLKVVNFKQHFVTGRGKYKIYNKAVDGVSFEVRRGEVFSIVGESGCGKTTTGRTIMRLYEPTDGEVFLLGKRIVAGTLSLKLKRKQLRKELSVKKQDLKNNQISKDEFDAFASNVSNQLDEIRKEIRQRKLDQENRYIPKEDEIKADKELAKENIEQLRKQIDELEAEYKLLKEKDGSNVQDAQSSDKDKAKSAKDYKNKLKEIQTSIRRLKDEINKNLMSSKAANKSLLKKMQMIFQDPIDSLDPRMTVKEIISEGLYINGIKNKTIVSEKVYHALKLVGLSPEHASHYPHEFSGGQRQRVGIARAIVCDPEVIIADEPISALDVSIQAQIINLLNDLKKELGLTIVFIAHDLSVVKHFSDDVAVMYYGRIVEMGHKNLVFDHPLHPYTKSLISSIPVPNPQFERLRKEITKYNPESHNYTPDTVVELREIEPGHKVLCSEEEYQEYLRIVNEKQ